MGMLDTEGRKYFSDKKIFADALNFLLYDGKPVIKPEKLKELDTTQITVPFGNGARLPIQKYRDILKLWCAMMADDVIYVILGAELQGKIHYAMPVKNNLYDAIGYSKQVDAAKASYKQNQKKTAFDNDGNLNDTKAESDDVASAEIMAEAEDIRIRLTSEEFLSGFRKGDKLIPIVTVTVYLGAEPWDGPLSLYDMFHVKNKEILKFVPNYFINLISPADMEDEEFDKFSTDLGLAMKVIKHQKEDADVILGRTRHRKIDRDTAFFLNRAVDLNLDFVEERGGVDMCLAMERKEQRDKITGMIEGMRLAGMEENDIINKITEVYGVTKEYIMSIITQKPVA